MSSSAASVLLFILVCAFSIVPSAAPAANITATPLPPKLLDCFCAGPHCGSTPACKGKMCLIGVIEGRVIKSCTPGLQAVRILVPSCYADVGVWSELCFCASTRCNSFTFFRNEFQKYKHSAISLPSLKQSLDDMTRPIVLKLKEDQLVLGMGKQDLNSGTLWLDETILPGALEARSTLPILLIVVPLIVGGMAVFIVVMNYYCKMC